MAKRTKLTKVPTKIKSLGDIKIQYKPLDNAEGYYREGLIEISTRQKSGAAASTLGHELLHYALD